MVITKDWNRCRCADGSVLWHDETLDPSIVKALVDDVDGLMASGTMLKDGDRTTLTHVATEHTPPCVIKRFNMKDPVHSIVHAPMRSRGRWNVWNTVQLHAAGIAAPAARALIEQRRGPTCWRSWFVCDFVEGPTLLDLAERAQATDSWSEIESAAAAFQLMWSRLKAARLHHGDFKASNMIVGEDGTLWLIDLDGMRRSHVGVLLDRARKRDLARFLRNWEPGSQVSKIFESLDLPI